MNHAPLLLTPPAHEAAIYRRKERGKKSRQERGLIQTERGASAEESWLGDKRHNKGSRRPEAQGKTKVRSDGQKRSAAR